MLQVNFLAVVLAAVACFVIGFLFHGPLFGKLWMKLANVTPTGNEKFSDMYGQMFMNLVANLVIAYVLALLYKALLYKEVISSYSPELSNSFGGILGLSVFVWLTIAASSSMEVIWMKRSYKLWLFEITSSLVCFLAMGAIIASM